MILIIISYLSIVAFIAQSFYAYRIRVLSRSYVVAGVTSFVSVLKFNHLTVFEIL